MTARCIRTLLHFKSHHTVRKIKPPEPRTYDQRARERARSTVATLACLNVCRTKSSSPALMRNSRLTLPIIHPIPWNTPFPVVLRFIRSPSAVAAVIAHAPRLCILYGHFSLVPCHRVSRNLPALLDGPVRDLAAGDAAIHPSPAADVRLSIVLEQVIQALFQHDTTAACACHEDLLSMEFASLSPST
jgi:hypothetical protein